jgi:hypothetical protein
MRTYIAKTNYHHVSYLAPEIELHFLSIEAATFRIMEAISIASVQVAENLKNKYIVVRTTTCVKGADLVVKHNAGTGNYKYFFLQALI